MDRKELTRRIKYGEGQLLIWQGRVAYAQAEVLSGHYKQRNMQQGREPTPEEKAQGITIGWRALSDDEKLHEAMQVIQRHLQFMSEVLDTLDDNRRLLDELGD